MAESEDGQERTEDPTPKRREEARKEGRVPRSQELSSALLLLGASLLLASSAGATIADRVREQFADSARWLAMPALTVADAQRLVERTGATVLLAVLPFAGMLLALGIGVNVLQARGIMTAKPLEPKLENLNPLAGLGRMLGSQAVFTLVKSLAKFALLGTVTWIALRAAWPQAVSLPGLEPAVVPVVVKALASKLVLSVGLAFLLIAGADYAFEVYRFEQSLKMSKQEVVQEQKEQEGNPLIKSRIKSLQQSLARKRMLADVRKATVVVTNPTHIAIALRYDAEAGGAPIVVAMGQRKLAERIKALAKEAGVPTVENRPLARALLATAKVGQMIPTELYTAVAEVLAYVYRRQGRRPA